MTLSFKTQIGGKPTFFIEKIWLNILNADYSTISEYQNYRMDFNNQLGHDWGDDGVKNAKLHTIREDKHDRWKAGTLIHPVIRPKGRFSDIFQFAPCFPCVSVQKIEIKQPGGSTISRNCPTIFIDDIFVLDFDVEKIAINDGFDSVEGFFAFFNKDFVGKILHFTDLKY